MTSKNYPERRRGRALAWCALLVALTAVAQPAPAPAWGLDQLMQQRAQVQSGRASYTEVRKVPSAEITTTSSGVLIYQAPHRLERQTAKPLPERAVVENGRLTLEFETETGQTSRREFALADLPGLSPFFTALRAVLAGDAAALHQGFQLLFEGDENAWRLKLTPRERAAQHVRDILMTGRGAEVLTLELRQKNGDSSRTTLTPEAVELKQPAPEIPPATAPATAPAAGS
jgi:outer membrane lipoprotein-sorting protein